MCPSCLWTGLAFLYLEEENPRYKHMEIIVNGDRAPATLRSTPV